MSWLKILQPPCFLTLTVALATYVVLKLNYCTVALAICVVFRVLYRNVILDDTGPSKECK